MHQEILPALGPDSAKTFVPDPHIFPRLSAPKAPCLLSSSDVTRLVEVTRSIRPKPKNPLRRETMRLAILLVDCCGLRLGELMRLRIEDVDSERRLLKIKETKFNKSRLVPLSPTLVSVLNEYLRHRRRKGIALDPDAPLVWSSQARKTRPLSAKGFRVVWRQVCRTAGVGKAKRRDETPDQRRLDAVA